MKYHLLLLFPLFIFSNCENTDKGACDTFDDLGVFSLLNESKDAIPYAATDQRAIFINEAGEERALNIKLLSNAYVEQQFTAACQADNTMLSTYEWEAERLCYELEDEAFGSFSYQFCVEMQYNLLRVTEKQVADLLKIEAFSSSSRLQREGDYTILLNPRNFVGEISTEGSLTLLDEFSWQGRTLNQVYHLETINNEGLERELYYNKTEGLVAFQDYFSDTFYFFDRIE